LGCDILVEARVVTIDELLGERIVATLGLPNGRFAQAAQQQKVYTISAAGFSRLLCQKGQQ
jgi:hypothetical protein